MLINNFIVSIQSMKILEERSVACKCTCDDHVLYEMFADVLSFSLPHKRMQEATRELETTQ